MKMLENNKIENWLEIRQLQLWNIVIRIQREIKGMELQTSQRKISEFRLHLSKMLCK
jgi:hypothetical protein